MQACRSRAPHARCQGLRIHVMFCKPTNQPTSNTHWLLQRAAEVLYTWQEQYLNKDPLELSFYPHFYAERESGRQEVGGSWVGVLGLGSVFRVEVAAGWAHRNHSPESASKPRSLPQHQAATCFAGRCLGHGMCTKLSGWLPHTTASEQLNRWSPLLPCSSRLASQVVMYGMYTDLSGGTKAAEKRLRALMEPLEASANIAY